MLLLFLQSLFVDQTFKSLCNILRDPVDTATAV